MKKFIKLSWDNDIYNIIWWEERQGHTQHSGGLGGNNIGPRSELEKVTIISWSRHYWQILASPAGENQTTQFYSEQLIITI